MPFFNSMSLVCISAAQISLTVNLALGPVKNVICRPRAVQHIRYSKTLVRFTVGKNTRDQLPLPPRFVYFLLYVCSRPTQLNTVCAVFKCLHSCSQGSSTPSGATALVPVSQRCMWEKKWKVLGVGTHIYETLERGYCAAKKQESFRVCSTTSGTAFCETAECLVCKSKAGNSCLAYMWYRLYTYF